MKGNFHPIRSTYPDVGSDTTSAWNLCARFSDVMIISQGNQRWCQKRSAAFAGYRSVSVSQYMYMKNCGRECGRSVNTSNLRSRGPGFKSRPSRCFLRRGTLLHFVSLYPGVQMGTDDILLGRNPAMDRHPVQGGVAILLGMLHAKETRTNSSRLGLWLVCAFTFLHANLNLPALSYQGIFYSVCCNVFPVLTVGLGCFLLF